MNNNKEVIRFIDRLYRDLYLSDEVLHHSTHNKTDKFNNLKEYFDMQEDMHNRAATLENRKKILKMLYHERYVIDENDIPDNYYELQKEKALNMGHGYLNINEQVKKQLQHEVIRNQEESLDRWINYFLGNETENYPFWTKYWAFQGMLKLGSFNRTNMVFNKRTKNTTAPFAELNKKALGKSMNLIIKVLNKDSIDDEELRRMVNDGSFQKIYSYYFAIEMKDLYNTDGIWVKYDKGGDYRKLAESLNGYQTHWCTEGLGTAEAQLACGDFYIYYTVDKQGNYKVPRLAIRMEDNNIAEIRGISENQNIEPEMKDVIEEKLKEFPDRDKYYKKAKHMDILTELYKKFNNNVDFSIEELRFLYEIDEYIVGFGHQHDPRINEILSKRDIYKDLSKIFNYDVKEGQENYIRSLRNGNAIKPNNPSFPKVLVGNIPFMENIDGIVFPDVLIGDINLGGVESIKNTKFPKRANSGSGSDKNGNLNIGTGSNNAVLENVIFPYEISGDLKVTARIAKDVVFPQIVHGNVDIKLDTYTNVVLPEEVIGTFELKIKYAKDITLPKRITKSIIIYSLGPTIENLKFPEICWSIALPEIIYGDGLILPRMLQHDLILDKLTHAKDMILPEVVGGDVNLCNLIDGTNLVLPKTIAKSLDLRNLVYCDGMVLPKKINGNLKISNVAVNYFGLDTLESIVDGKINIYDENKALSNKDKSI